MGHTLTTRPSLTKLQSLDTIMNVSKVNREGAQGDNYKMIKHVEKTKIMSSSKLKHKTFKQASHPETATIFLGLS